MLELLEDHRISYQSIVKSTIEKILIESNVKLVIEKLNVHDDDFRNLIVDILCNRKDISINEIRNTFKAGFTDIVAVQILWQFRLGIVGFILQYPLGCSVRVL